MTSIWTLTRRAIDEGALRDVLPEFYDQIQTIENTRWHDHDTVYNHVISVFEHLKAVVSFETLQPQAQVLLKQTLNTSVGNHSRKSLLGWATLCHDLAGGAEKTRLILEELIETENFKPLDIEYVVKLVAMHDQPHHLIEVDKSLSKNHQAFKRYQAQVRDLFWPLVILAQADTQGSQLEQSDPEEFEFRMQVFDLVLNGATQG
jgi:hypothetical protein